MAKHSKEDLMKRDPLQRRRVAGVGLIVLAAWSTPQGLATVHAGCTDDPSFKGSASAVLERGYGLGDGLICLVAGRKAVVAGGRSRNTKSIVGEFVRDGRLIHFETLRGGRTPKALRRDDPEAPRYEVDLRFTNAEGVPVLGQCGGCGPIDPSWEPDEPDGEGAVSEQSQVDFTSIEMAITALQNRPFKRKFAPEYQALLGQAALAHDGTAPFVIDPSADVIYEEEGSSAVGGTPRSHLNVYRHVIKVFADYIHPIFPAASHAATVAYRIHPNGYVEYAWDRCNHGRCYYQLTGPFANWCGFVSGANRSAHVHRQTCATLYNPFSFSGTHNCNDDAATEYRAVRYNYHPDGVTGTCSDSFRHDFTDGCY